MGYAHSKCVRALNGPSTVSSFLFSFSVPRRLTAAWFVDGEACTEVCSVQDHSADVFWKKNNSVLNIVLSLFSLITFSF